MSTVTFCDGCGVELGGKGKPVYRAAIQAPSEGDLHWHGCRYDLCRQCAKPLMEWKRVNPKRDGNK
jgi:hypothetical protein